MLRKTLLPCIIVVSICSLTAQQVNLSGTVKKSGSNTPLSGVKISLVKMTSLSATTGNDGKFTITNVVSTLVPLQQPEPLRFLLRGTSIVFYPNSRKASGQVELFSGNGKRYAVTPFSDIETGVQQIELPEFVSGLNLIRVTVDGISYTRTLMCLPGDRYVINEPLGIATERNFIFGKRASSPPDTIVATKTGFTTKKVALTSYTQQNMEILIDSIVQSSNINWLPEGYSCTVFGDKSSGDCSGVPGIQDQTKIDQANCVGGTRTVTLNSENRKWYGAVGDISSLWQGATCVCQSGGTCIPSCQDQKTCGKRMAVKCDPNSTAKYSNGDSRSGSQWCNPNQYVVVEIIDACPHNHSNNPWWCTSNQPNHIDISCSGLKEIAGKPDQIGNWGWIGVRVALVDNSVALGPHQGQ